MRTVSRYQNGIVVVALQIATAQRIVFLLVQHPRANDVVIPQTDGRKGIIVASNLGFQMHSQTLEGPPVYAGDARLELVGLLGGNPRPRRSGRGGVFNRADLPV